MPILLQADTIVTRTMVKTQELAKPDFWDRIIRFVQVYGLKLILAILIFMIGKWLAGVIARSLRAVMGKKKVDGTLASFANSILYALMILVVILIALSQLGVKTSSFMVIVGAAVLAVGLALQGTLSNFAAGVMLIGLRPFKIGDVVTAGGQTGTVYEIGIITTTILSSDNKKIIVPNSAVASGAITNFSAMPTRKIELSVVVPGTTDLNKARDIIRGILSSDSRILASPAAGISIADTSAEEIKFGVSAHVNNADMGAVQSDILEKIKRSFTEAGIWA